MSFVFNPEPRVWWPVKVRVPADNGASETQEFSARFLVVPRDRFVALFDDSAEALLRKVVIDWKGVIDELKTPIPFDAGALDLLLGIPFIAAALADAYREVMAGGARKN